MIWAGVYFLVDLVHLILNLPCCKLRMAGWFYRHIPGMSWPTWWVNEEMFGGWSSITDFGRGPGVSWFCSWTRTCTTCPHVSNAGPYIFHGLFRGGFAGDCICTASGSYGGFFERARSVCWAITPSCGGYFANLMFSFWCRSICCYLCILIVPIHCSSGMEFRIKGRVAESSIPSPMPLWQCGRLLCSTSARNVAWVAVEWSVQHQAATIGSHRQSCEDVSRL